LVKSSKGYRAGTRSILSRRARDRGKLGLSKLLYPYNPGSRVCITINPSIHKGMPHRRFHGKIGFVKAKRGRSYVVEVLMGGWRKTVIARPEHLSPYGGESNAEKDN